MLGKAEKRHEGSSKQIRFLAHFKYNFRKHASSEI